MIAAWILYLLVLSSMLGLAALSAERALRWLNKPVRAIWALALFGTPATGILVARTGGLRLIGAGESSSSGTVAPASTLGADSVSALERWVASARAAPSGRYPSVSTADRTRERISGFTSSCAPRQRDTVAVDTFAKAATSASVVLRSLSVF